jgi:hypothetical protein
LKIKKDQKKDKKKKNKHNESQKEKNNENNNFSESKSPFTEDRQNTQETLIDLHIQSQVTPNERYISPKDFPIASLDANKKHVTIHKSIKREKSKKEIKKEKKEAQKKKKEEKKSEHKKKKTKNIKRIIILIFKQISN